MMPLANAIEAAVDFAANVIRLGWYTEIGALAEQTARRAGYVPVPAPPGRIVPDKNAVLADLMDLFRRDADLVRWGAAARTSGAAGGILDHLSRVQKLLEDIPSTIARRNVRKVDTAREAAVAHGLPDYFAQDFHFQTGGYLSDDSARLYDIQVETLFRGSALAMRRQALRPIADFMSGRDQRHVRLLDVGCGTGRFLREVRRAYPAMHLTGLDLSGPYLVEAERHLQDLRPVCWLEGNAERMPLPDASQDIVTTMYLFHELPPEVRRTVIHDLARVLKPGGLVVFIDSLQKGDRPGGWDGFLEGFPERFHEPYYRHYTIDDLDSAFGTAGLVPVAMWPAFLSKVMVRMKRDSRP